MNKEIIYSPYKIAHYKHNLILGTPVTAHIDLTDRCNHRCFFCGSQYQLNFDYTQELSGEKWVDIIEQLPIQAIVMCGGGDPLMHRSFTTVARYCLNKGLRCGLITNGQLWNDEVTKVASKFDWVRISIDASTQETYEKQRGVKDNIQNVFVRHVPPPVVYGANFVVTKYNFREIADFARIIKLSGFDNCRFVFPFPHDPELKGYSNEVISQLEEAKSHSDDDFTVFASHMERLTGKEAKNTFTTCYYSSIALTIDASGNMYTCCQLKLNQRGIMGNLLESSFSDIWATRVPPEVSKCQPCWMAPKNEIAEYIMMENPSHGVFI